MKKLSTKIWVLIVLFLLSTIAFMFLFTDYLYEQLYVNDTKQSMVEVGVKIQSLYEGGKVTDEFLEKIDEFNNYMNYTVLAVRNPRELSACVPFEIDYETLIGQEERQQLLEGKSITKIGYVPRFERHVISVILPLTDQNRLEGIIYLYYPLAKITELANKEVFLLIGGATLFSILIGFLVFKGLKRIMRPLLDLQKAVEKMSKGEYETRVKVLSKDEIGTLSNAFNKMAEAIQKEDEERKVFLANVSHELRTPISYIKGYSEMIHGGKISEDNKEEAMALIVREANRMERLTNELLMLIRMTNEKEEIELYPVVLAETIREACQLLTQKAKEKQIELQLEIDEQFIVEGNEEKLKQIFINVIENAINYSSEGKNIKIQTRLNKNYVDIIVEDNGIGIPEEDLPFITERFYRVNKARTRFDGGSGLGLSIVNQLVKQLNGTIHFHSTVGKGTVVTISVPVLEDI